MINSILCGDAYELIKEIPDGSVDMVYTDIPYLYSGGLGGGSSRVAGSITAKNKELQDISDGINYSIFDEFIRICKKLNCFIWCSKEQLPDVMNFFLSKGYYYDLLVWQKTNPIPQCCNTWLSDLEYCLHFREKRVKLNDGFELKRKCYSSPINIRDKEAYAHPTIKPLKFVEQHILHASQPNDIILDPFIGSGTTAVACVINGRRYIGFEKNPKWHKVACDRLNGVETDGQLRLFIK